MRRVLLAQVRAHAGRLVASTTAVVIAVAFVVATLVLNQTARTTVLDAVGAQYTGADLVVSSTEGDTLADQVPAVAAVPGVTAVAPQWDTSLQAVLPGTTGARYVSIGAVADAPALRWQQLAAGSLPTQPGQIALSAGSDVAVGDVVPFTTYDADGTELTGDLTVTGLVDTSGSVTGGLFTQGFVTPEQARQWGAWASELLVAGDPDPAALQAALTTTGEVTVRTGTEAAEAAAAAMTGDSDALAVVLLVFATVAVLVAGLVIANTFAVLLAQRTRELALLRCVGATSGQIRRSVLGEALVTGLAASVLGVLAGTGLAAAVSALAGALDSPIPLAGVSVPWVAVVAGLVVGTVTTVVAALAPARAATRVAPLAALRPVDAAPLRSRPGVLRLVLGLLLLVPGTALLLVGAVAGEVLVALPGGVLSFLGALLLAQRAVPPVVAAAGRLLGRAGGVPGRLAAGNATRNPRRTAATATALVIGVTLTTAMVVGAASARATASAGLDAAYPTDVVVAGFGADMPKSLVGQLTGVDGVAAGVGITTGEVTGPDGEVWSADGFDVPATLPVLRSAVDEPLPELGQVVLPGYLADQWGVRDGDPVALSAGDRSLTLTTVVGSDDLAAPRLTGTELSALVPDAGLGTVWLRLADAADTATAVEAVTDLAGTAVPTAFVTGIASERAALDDVLDTLLLVVTGLLGVAVLIALIGVGNTLALSVVERRQESGLLRALGLTRRQLRGLLAWEAVLVAGVAAVLGVLLGGGYGVVGAASVLGSLSANGTVISVPWLQVGAIVVVATAAGLLASVLPSRRAARTPPVAAIAA
ncbi:ABC transporter permease [Klenkia brasiliensis]|uniref:Putative ABC transport system permease protein n=1 Tax=Klenkia brasiliensis TaxID=333142 RepID=A0A1G7NER3_9ACTN|nr:FtsX-like permease family protein [Klenkia brasiliensis]SDF71789.1 putative ABC transport system permease protein [Klenkia brasiliensis]